MDVGLVFSRWLRLVWASYMTAVAGSLLIGSWKLSKTAKTNTWENVKFEGVVENDIITGKMIWENKTYNLSWSGTIVPTTVQVLEVEGKPLEIKTGRLTRKDEMKIVRNMLMLAVVILIITWFIASYTYKHRFLIKI
jgi:hypothetical protein